MRLVHRDQPDIELAQRVQHALCHQPLGCEVEQGGLARDGAAPGRDVVVTLLRRVNAVGGDTGQAQGRDLILH